MRCKILAATSSMVICLSFLPAVFADNPIIQTNYTADPAPLVHGDTLYLYTSHDEDNAQGFVMNNWMCYTTTDMVNWTDHGIVASLQNFSWQAGSAWAPQGCFRNGKWYLYCPLNQKSGGMAVGVLTSNSPFGPFTDPINKPVACCSYDPTIFIDDDGQAYLYFGGNGPCYWIKVNQDMISTTGSNATASIDFTGCPSTASFTEGPWLFKHGTNYYLAWASRCCPEGIGYAMSTSPMGPWKCKGLIMAPSDSSSGNHPGIVEYKGKWYVFGFNYSLLYSRIPYSTSKPERRSICVKEMTYNTDGTIQQVPWWGNRVPLPSVPQVDSLNPYDTTQAETICWSFGVRTEVCKDAGAGLDVDSIHNNDFIKVKGVDFKTGAKSFEARVASATSGGSIELHLDTTTGPLVGTCAVAGTNGWQTWTTKSCDVSNATGVHDLYLKFTGGSGLLFNFNWWKFTPAVGIQETGAKGFESVSTIKVRYNPSTVSVVIGYALLDTRCVTMNIFDQRGRRISEVVEGVIPAGRHAAVWNAKGFPSGVYVCRMAFDGIEGWAGKIVVGR
jgi:arabinoxylan arabinofuranohydrolase